MEQKAIALEVEVHPSIVSRERGTNENTTGLVRQYFPKKSLFEALTQEDVQFVQDKLNHRSRHVIGSRTPHEVFYNLTSIALTT